MKTYARYIFLITIVLARTSLFAQDQLVIGDEKLDEYLPLLKGMKVGVLVNHTSMVHGNHLVDTLLSLEIDIKKVFAPEHGFRGNADAGEHVSNSKDLKTGLPIVSLYGSNRKPKAEQIEDLDVIIFDVQDVGVRFYTYISSMHYMMEACAENGKKIIVLDRPNPNGDYVAGPVLDMEFQSFVGMHPIPVVYGLTVGELAKMINGEKWLEGGLECDLTVIECSGYKHSDRYNLPIKPSPNLPNDLSIRLYPSLCFFEPTQVSIGRGTYTPFQVIGMADKASAGDFSFTPKSIDGMSKHPKHEGKVCYGEKFETASKFSLSYLVKYFELYGDESSFITSKSFFNKLVGNNTLIDQLKSGLSASEIESSWEKELSDYKVLRSKYLLYND